MNKNDKKTRIFIAGHLGMVGSSLHKRLKKIEGNELVYRTHKELDLTNQFEVKEFFENEIIDQVYLAAAKVGGIYANNTYPADFIYSNLMIQSIVINEAFKSGVKKLLFLGSSCIYPKFSTQPMKEEELLTGILEPTNEPYAIAKIAGIKTCESYNRQYKDTHGIDYRCVMPTNLYGPGDNYHLENSHVIPGLIRRFHESKVAGKESFKIWGSGSPRREFLFVDDFSEACEFLMNLEYSVYKKKLGKVHHINVGSGEEISIGNLGKLIARIVGFEGEILFDDNKPDGTPRKLLDSSRINQIGWSSKTELERGIEITYKKYLGTIQ